MKIASYPFQSALPGLHAFSYEKSCICGCLPFISGTMTELEKIELLLGETPELCMYKQAKLKHDRNPHVKSLEAAMEMQFVKIQTCVSRKFSDVKKLLISMPNDTKLLFQKKLGERLLKGWKYYNSL